MPDPLVSIIVPVHNTEPYLNRALDSLTHQTLRELEVICVDDGSTDGSPAILQDWARLDSRIRIITFEHNQGVSAARNAGFEQGKGNYIYYLDSDDWIDADYLEAMYAKARETGQDVVANANYVLEFEDGSQNAVSGDFGFIHEGYYPTARVQTFFLPTVCTRLYKREYLSRIGLRFPPLKNGEDIYYTGLAELMQKSSYVFRGPLHHYWQRDSSLTHERGKGYYYIQSFKLLFDELVKRGIPTEDIRLFYAGPLVLDTQEKFDFVRAFMLEIEPQVRRHPQLYVAHDLFLMDAVIGCSDYTEFLSKYNPNIALAFIRSRMRRTPSNA